jgi:plastocyanin
MSKKIYLILFICVAVLGTKAATFTITATNFQFTPATLTVSVGDVIFFKGMAGGHPTVQVDATTWASNGATPLSGGFGPNSADFTYTATTVGTVYYVCQFHVSSFGMKGMITVNGTAGVNENNFSLNNFSLFPNPASGKVQINFGLNSSSTVSVKLFNMIGQEVKVLSPASSLPEGNYNYSYDVATLPQGNYFIEVIADNRKIVKKLVLTN